MSSPEPDASNADLNAADVLRWAELRHAMLQRLASLGMRVAEEVAERTVNSPYHPEARHEPGRAFAAISRAVRLTVVLEAKVAVEVIAIRNGSPPSLAASARRREPTASPVSADDGEHARPRRDHLHEDLIDREVLDPFLETRSPNTPSPAKAEVQCSALPKARPAERDPRLREERAEASDPSAPPGRYFSLPPPTP